MSWSLDHLIPAVEQTFTINLVSNASMQGYAENTLAQLTTLLPHRIELD